MAQYILRRVIQSLFIIWGCATLVFFMLRMIPGDPVVQMLGPEYTPEAAERCAQKLGLTSHCTCSTCVGWAMC